MRAEARGGGGEGILGWHRRATSAYTWCVTEKGPQRRRLHKIGKVDTPGCYCHQEQSGEHTVEEWGTRHSRDKKKKKGDVGVEKAEEEKGEKIGRFFCEVHEFLTDYTNFLNGSTPSHPFCSSCYPGSFCTVYKLRPITHRVTYGRQIQYNTIFYIY